MSYVNLLPSNTSDEMRAVDEVASQRIDLLSKSDFNLLPQSCKKELLPHLAYMYDLDISGLQEQGIRDYISSAFEVKKYQGTIYAVRLSLKSIFNEAEIIEWFEDKNDVLEPFHFKANLVMKSNTSTSYDPMKFEKAKQLINASKNARSVFDGFNVKLPDVIVASNLQSAGVSNIQLKNELKFKDGLCEIKSQVGSVANIQLKNKLKFKNGLCNIKNQIGGVLNIELKNELKFKNGSCKIKILGGCIWTI